MMCGCSSILAMSYMFKNGFRLVIPYIDKLKYRVKGGWVGRDVRGALREQLPFAKELDGAFTLGHVLVNRTPVESSFKLALGQTVELVFHRHEPEVLDSPIEVLHVDKYFAAVHKPPSVPVHPVGKFNKNTVVKILRSEHPELFSNGEDLKVAHRLDRLVSGVLILARSSSAASLLQKLMRKNFVEKEYLARVKGTFPEGRLDVTQPVAHLQEDPPIYGVSEEGRSARTMFERESVSADGSQSLVWCRPVTGRSHQIRVHLQWLGHPIVNDYKYGGSLQYHGNPPPSSVPEPEPYEKVEWCRECVQGRRDTSTVSQEDLSVYCIWLHALSYTSTHPGYQWRFEALSPKWAQLE